MPAEYARMPAEGKNVPVEYDRMPADPDRMPAEYEFFLVEDKNCRVDWPRSPTVPARARLDGERGAQQFSRVQRLGKNLGGYHGEPLDIVTLLRDVAEAAQRHGWTGERLHTETGLEIQTWVRAPAAAKRRLYFSAGIHGDEPAGPLAVRQLLQENAFPADAAVWLCPCLNPGGFPRSTRENPAGIDLNRQYLNPTAAETFAHIAWLERQPDFDTAVCLHEDWESNGFYLYELNPEDRPTHADEILRRVGAVCPIDHSEMIENRPARGGLIRPSTDPRSRPDWPEAFWLLTHKTRHSYTLEAPSDFPLATRVAALVEASRVILERA